MALRAVSMERQSLQGQNCQYKRPRPLTITGVTFFESHQNDKITDIKGELFSQQKIVL